MRILLMFFLTFGKFAFADVNTANKFTLNLYKDLVSTTKLLHDSTIQNCSVPIVKLAYQNSFDAWIAASVIQFGPIQKLGGQISFSFWPDKRGFTKKKLIQLIDEKNLSVSNNIDFQEISIAGKGFMALEQLLYEETFINHKQKEYICLLIRSISQDLNIKAHYLEMNWRVKFQKETSNGTANIESSLLHQDELAAAYLTSIISGLKFNEINRIGLPLGKFKKSRSKRAEAWRSSRSLRNIEISLKTLFEFSLLLSDKNLHVMEESFMNAIKFIDTIDNNSFKNIHKIKYQFQLESLLTLIRITRDAVSLELSQHLGVISGFNALDGD